jgi:hypothetical protein
MMTEPEIRAQIAEIEKQIHGHIEALNVLNGARQAYLSVLGELQQSTEAAPEKVQ